MKYAKRKQEQGYQPLTKTPGLQKLDAEVLANYNWLFDLTDMQILEKQLAFDLERAGK